MRTPEQIAEAALRMSLMARRLIHSVYDNPELAELTGHDVTEDGKALGKYLSEHPELLQEGVA